MQYTLRHEGDIQKLSSYVTLYETQYKDFRRPSYNETEVRVDFVNPFFKLLGWDVDNEAGLPQHLREVTHEATVLVEEAGRKKSKKPDYSFRIGTETCFFLETKKPAVDITTDSAPAFQLRRYGWSGNLKVSVLTNYTDLYIYDCSVRPVENDNVGIALIAHYNYREYVEKFDEIYALLSKEAVLSGAFAERFENIDGSIRREPFDEYFLKQIKGWRLMLGADIARRNPGVDLQTLNIGVQRILNRIIFLRICEDRNLEQYELLKNVKTYSELKTLFLAADKKYDSGLFEFLEEDRLSLSDNVLINIFVNLYYPNNSYEFSVVDPFIIGQIYELFLDEQLIISPVGTVVAVKKPEAVDAKGAVNTPKNITDIIVEQTLSEVVHGKTLNEVSQLRIADICCGSGNFLLSAFEFLINFHIEWYLSRAKDAALRMGYIYQIPGTDEYRLSFELRRRILTANLFGVDIDPLAVEVSKFSLCLKLLENASSGELDAFSSIPGEKILPRLDDNIKNGNSLVTSAYVSFQSDIYNRPDELTQIRMFDWQAEFGRTGFDAIVGNPPYIRVQNMVHYSPGEYAFYKTGMSGFETSKSSLLDKYYLFIERAWSLLKPGGRIGYIVPHKFMTIASGEVLRSYLSSRSSVAKIIHFGIHQVFKGRLTYTCILVLTKEPQEKFAISFVKDYNQFLFNHKAAFTQYTSNYLGAGPWTFLPPEINERLEQLRPHCVPLKELADVFVGVQTSADKIYIIEAEYKDDRYVYFTDKAGKPRRIEQDILRFSIYDAQLRKYDQIKANSYIIFPYKTVEGKPVLIDYDEMRSRFPAAYDYLSAFREELDKRNMPNRTDRTWYAYGRSQSLKRFTGKPHLIWPVLSTDSNYVYDIGFTVFTGGGNGPFYGLEMKPGVSEYIYYIQAILNHWLMETLVRNSSSVFQGDYYSHGKQFIADLPIYRIDFNDEKEKNHYVAIIHSVTTLMDLYKNMRQARNSMDKRSYERSVEFEKEHLELLIDGLYGVTDLHPEVVDEGTE